MPQENTELLFTISRTLKEISLFLVALLFWLFVRDLSDVLFLINSETKVSNGIYYQIAEIEGERFIIQKNQGLRQIVGKLETK